jgi:type II secretory pathway pseudopilin PulG
MKIKRGFALIFVFFVIAVLGILAAALLSRSISESNIARKNAESIQAFWLAEAGVHRALEELRDNYNQSGTNLWSTALNQGGYFVDIAIVDQDREVTAHGFIPFTGTLRVERIIEALMRKSIPPNFYGNAIYTSGNVDLNGNSYNIVGNVLYAGSIDNTDNINGTITQDDSINPLARLDYQQLLTRSQAQHNVYTYNTKGKLVNQYTGQQGFPASFWYSPPSDPNDPTTGVPNVVYVMGDLELRGNIGTIGGFYVVVGDVITNPDVSYDATINGNGIVEGAIYTRGEFRINGGGGNLNINGGIWAGEQARLNGNATVSYNHDYMLAIQGLNINVEVQIYSWKEQLNPYQLSP